MFVEIHMIQNFAPSNLNRDDTGAPKDCTFGGVRRARISSQCLKRSIREDFKKKASQTKDVALFKEEELAFRTKALVKEIVGGLVKDGKDPDEARTAVAILLRGAGLGVKETKAGTGNLKEFKTEYLLFLGKSVIQKFVELCSVHWDLLTGAAASDQGEKEVDRKKRKKISQSMIPKEIRDKVIEILDGSKAADLALFGRMLADLPDRNIDAASQVAHAISTHKVAMEFDFYTAVDDLQPKEETGAGMMGTVEFNSACFYRYANIDTEQLLENLGNDGDLAARTVKAFLHASKDAIPTGKQNSFAALNPPAFILAVVRNEGFPVNLANAFERPVAVGRQAGLVVPSVEALDHHWAEYKKVYGDSGIKLLAASRIGSEPELKGLSETKGFVECSFPELVEKVMEAVEFPKGV